MTLSLTKLVSYFILDIYHIPDIGAMQSGPRRNSRETKRARSTPAPLKNDNSVLTSARNELDTRANTICVGHNWLILSPTGQTCDVRGFHEDFESIKDVPIVRAASVYTDENGRRYLLIINEALHFGSGMDHSLINLRIKSDTMEFLYLTTPTTGTKFLASTMRK